jgi:small GTP-binding protein
MIIKEKICKIQIWDTAGQERYKSITNSYYKGADAIFIIFDMNNKESLIHVDDWINEVIKLTGENILFFVGGNKFDLSNKEVSNMDIEIFKKKKKLNVFVLSAKSGFGIENAFKEIIECLVNNCEGNKDKIKRDEFSLQIEKANFEKKKRVCCGNNK